MSGKPDHLDGRKVRAQRRRSARREQLLAAARRVFSARGYHACSVADILQEAGVARGTFYLYFPSKRALFEVLLDQMLTQLRGGLIRVQVEEGQPPVTEQMHRNVRAVLQVLEDNRELTIILLREAVGLDADFDQKLNTFYDHLSGVIEDALELGLSMNIVRECDTSLAAHCVLGSVKEVTTRLIAHQEAERPDLDRLAREIMDFNLKGLFA